MKIPRFQPGDEVSWVSQAQGSAKEKKGTVIAVLASGESAAEALRKHPAWNAAPGWSRVHFQAISLNVRYLVEVARGKTTHYYAPLCSVVDRQMAVRDAAKAVDNG